MAKGNKYGITKDDTRYGDMAQPKHTNEWGYHEDQSTPSQGNAPQPETSGGGESYHERPSMQQDSHPEHNMPRPEHNGVEIKANPGGQD